LGQKKGHFRCRVAGGVIVCLHYIAAPGQRRRLAITAEQLDAIVAREKEAGRRAGTLADALDDERFVLTFDDAHKSLLDLRALDVPAAVFVPTDYVGMSDEVLSWDDLRALRDAGWTIGSHSRTHVRMSWKLYDEDDAAYAKRLDDECTRSREILEEKLGITVRDFAYPYGDFTPAARSAVERAGYTRAFTVNESLEWKGDELAIPRLDGMEAHGLIRARSQEPMPISVVVPACDRHETLAHVVKRLAEQSYPREKYEVIVVDDGSKSSLRPCLEGAPDNVRLIEKAGEVGKFNAGQARQRGADEAKFDTLAFLDADVCVAGDFLWALDWVHQRTNDAVVLGYLSGYNLHDIGFTHSLKDVKEGDPAIIVDRSREPALRACFDNVDWLEEPWRLAYTGNLSVTRAALAKAGGFARDFSGWGLEDLDLGYRLFKTGAAFVFSRFAIGHHVVDASEATSRNPFRAPHPERAMFAGYEKNLATLLALHPNDATIERFAAQARADIDETCGRPTTVGIEFGGACPLECAFHRQVHRCQSGGVSTNDLLDRLAYAVKVGAKRLYLLGGDPAMHPGFLTLVRAARAAGLGVTSESTALPFAKDDFAREARAAGLGRVVVEIVALDAAEYDAVTRSKGRFPDFVAGIQRIREAGISCGARVIGSPDLEHAVRAEGWEVEAVVDWRPS
jgi:peptidoglycan/xylan/chitin deacetylase (PgdA/CDA1 family)/GT2 family glycosyltransferase